MPMPVHMPVPGANKKASVQQGLYGNLQVSVQGPVQGPVQVPVQGPRGFSLYCSKGEVLRGRAHGLEISTIPADTCPVHSARVVTWVQAPRGG